MYSIVKMQKRNISLTYFNSFLTFWLNCLSEWSCCAALILFKLTWCHQCFVQLWTQSDICSDIISTLLFSGCSAPVLLLLTWTEWNRRVGLVVRSASSATVVGCGRLPHTPVRLTRLPAWSAGRISGLKYRVPSAVRRNRSCTQSAADMGDQEKRVWDTHCRGVHRKVAEQSGTAGQQCPAGESCAQKSNFSWAVNRKLCAGC